MWHLSRYDDQPNQERSGSVNIETAINVQDRAQVTGNTFNNTIHAERPKFSDPQRCKQIRGALNGHFKAKKKVVLVWTESTDEKSSDASLRQWFWRDLWDVRLPEFLDRGLVILVHSPAYGEKAIWSVEASALNRNRDETIVLPPNMMENLEDQVRSDLHRLIGKMKNLDEDSPEVTIRASEFLNGLGPGPYMEQLYLRYKTASLGWSA